MTAYARVISFFLSVDCIEKCGNYQDPDEIISDSEEDKFDEIKTCLATHCEGNSVKDCRVECSPCYPLCKTCTGPNKEDCVDCNSDIGSNSAAAGCDCASHFYYDPNTKFCQECSSLCGECTGPSSKDCTSCASNAYQILDQDNGLEECVSFCNINGFYPDGRTCKSTFSSLIK